MRRIVGLLLVVAVIAAACASDEDAADTAAAATTRAPVTTVATTTPTTIQAPATPTTTTSTTRPPTTTAVDVAGCDATTEPINVYETPLETGDGWETASLQEVGMDPEPLVDLLELIADTDNHLIHSLLIVKDQKLVFEEYWPGVERQTPSWILAVKCFDRDTLHSVGSVSKSITSALFGIALDDGLIGSVDDPLFSFFPEYSDLKRDDNEGIRLRHLLSFSSGYEWSEFVDGPDDPGDYLDQTLNTRDPMGFLLGRPMVSDSGSEFLYNSGDTDLVGEIVRKVTSSPTLAEYARENLFQPLGIEAYYWWSFPLAPDITFAAGGASLRPRDMAKIGALYLNGGVWNGERILSSEWIEASTEQTMPLSGPPYITVNGYGYNWWLGRFQFGDEQIEYFRAAGLGGQEIIVLPEIESIVVLTAGGWFHYPPISEIDMIEDYILHAILD